jgi:Right handed beta helix region
VPIPAPTTPQEQVLPPSDSNGDQVGFQFWGSGNLGQGVVQDRSILPVEMFPFFRMDQSLYFTDLRFFPTIEGTFGGSVGAGYRFFSPSWDRVFGISGWYDADGTRDDYFQQLGLSLETYGGPFDFRTNFYLPIGQTDRQNSLAIINNSSRFVGNNVVYDQIDTFTAAMRGLDMEVGVGLPGQFARHHALRVYAGWYYFNDDQGDNIVGVSGRIQGTIASGLDASVEITNDNFFDTRAFATLSWTFGPLRRADASGMTTADRLGEHVTRNYTVLAPTRSTIDANVTAVDPTTGTPYTFAHVSSAAGAGGNGTVNSPFQTIAQAQASNDQIIFVHANSVFTGAAASITMGPGQSILGDGAGLLHTLAVPQLGSIVLPHSTTGSLPVFESSIGNAVTLASNSLLSGFTIASPAANGIYGNGVSNAIVANVTVTNAGADGIHLLNSTSAIGILNTSVSGSVGDGLALLGGTGNVTVSGLFAGNQGHDLNISNIGGGTIDLTQAQFGGSGSQGILLQNDAGTINFNNLSVSNTAGRGIDIEGESGTVQFAGTTTVSGAAGTSVNVESLLSSGTVTFADLAINNRQGTGLAIDNASGAFTVNGTTNITNAGGATASALSVTNSSGTVTFNGAVNVANSTGSPGVNLVNNSGTTTINTLNITSSGGTALYANNGGTLNVSDATTGSTGGTIQATNGTAVDLENTALDVNLMSVSSSGASVGLKLISTSGGFGVYGPSGGAAGSGGTIQGATTGVLLQNTGTVGLALMNIDSNGVGIQAQNVSSLVLGGVHITNSTSYGVDALDVKSLSVGNSQFYGNGAANIRFQADQIGAYSLNSNLNAFGTASGDNILVQSLSGSEGSTLTFTAAENGFVNSNSGTAAINVNWNGNLSATIDSNSFSGAGGSNTGVHIDALSPTALATVAIANNTYSGGAANDIGYQVIAAGPSQTTVSGNTVQFGATGGTGFRFSLAPSASLELATNSVTDTAGGATGVLFDSISGPSNLDINGNTVTLSNHGNGIIFSSVTDPVVSGVTYSPILSGTQNNVISGASTPFSIPSGTTSGGFLVNGTVVP